MDDKCKCGAVKGKSRCTCERKLMQSKFKPKETEGKLMMAKETNFKGGKAPIIKPSYINEGKSRTIKR